VRLQPFDPDKTTVLFVHGLVDSPATWVPMIQSLRADPEIRKRYQFWFFGYPSGYPYQFSASALRRELDAALKVFPQKKPMILVGHSMGGLICRLMITDSSDKLWQLIFRKAPDEFQLTSESTRLLRESYYFKARPDVSRAIFIASPHRGSELASGWLGRLGARLIRVPAILVRTSLEIATLGGLADGKPMRHAPNSVDTLSPENSFVKAINQIPRKRGVPVHSIIGDRGKGDSPDSSDGVVPYWSSHLKDANSEKIVPSDHSAHQHPEAIAEVLRLLKASR
jgi:pimeloyl-ACP methyl ester carboxylesterase